MIKKDLIPYSDQNTALEGFVAYSTEEKRPLVILCHAWKGRDEFICEKAEHIAKMGYAGFAIDMYGKGIFGKSQEESALLKKPFVDDRLFLQRRLLQGYKTACTLPYVDTKRIVAIGFGFGAMCALDLARSAVSLQGAVSIYGHFEPPLTVEIKPIQAKILILHGYKDPVARLSELEAFTKELDQAKVDWQAHIYGDASHAFATPSANNPEAGIMYNPKAAKRAWNAVETFLAEVLE